MRRDFGSIRKLPSGRWQARYRGPDGRSHRGHRTFPRKGMAQGWLDAEDRLIARGEWTPPADRDPNRVTEAPTLGAWAETRIRARERRSHKPIRPRTAEGYRALIAGPLAPLAGLNLTTITPAVVARWHAALPDTPTRNAHAYALLRSLLADAVDAELIERNPCRLRGAGKPEPRREPEVLTAAELAEYLAAAEPHRRAILALTALCALRSSEVRALRRCDVDDDATTIHVVQGVTRLEHGDEHARFVIAKPKTAAAQRSIAVPSSIQPLLVETLNNHRRGPDALLFPAADGIHPLNDSVLYKAHKRAALAIGRSTLTLHDLRRTGATLAAQSGATTKEIMRRLGHTRPDVAMLYQVADALRDRAVADAMPPIQLPPVSSPHTPSAQTPPSVED